MLHELQEHNWSCLQQKLKWEVWVGSQNQIYKFPTLMLGEFPSLCLGGWCTFWCMLACVGCWNLTKLGPVGWGNWVDWHKFGWDGLRSCSSCRRNVLCCSGLAFPFVLFNFGTEHRDLGATEESEFQSSSVIMEGWGWGRSVLCGRRNASFTVHRLSYSRLKASVH
jgi:hypothetical protein